MLTPIQIGYPKQDIIAFINFNYNNLLIGELLQIPNKIYSNTFYKGYKYNKSYSFKILQIKILQEMHFQQHLFVKKNYFYLLKLKILRKIYILVFLILNLQ